jgi:hypothetical protein
MRSSSPNANNTDNAWIVNFNNGNDGNNNKNNDNQVRLVRGGECDPGPVPLGAGLPSLSDLPAPQAR